MIQYRHAMCNRTQMHIPEPTKAGFCRASCPLLPECEWCARKPTRSGGVTRVAPCSRCCPWYEEEEKGE